MKIRMLLDAYRRNFRMTQWPANVLDAFEEPALIVEHFYKAKATIDADTNLSEVGKQAARRKAVDTAVGALKKWHAPRLAGLDTQVAQERAGLVPAAPKPDPRKVDYLLSQLQRHSPQEIATFYNSATDEERQLMEAASASVGRIPTKTGQGLEWRPLIDPGAVNESVLARATARNPAGVAKYNELAEIRAMHVTVAQHAEREIREAIQ